MTAETEHAPGRTRIRRGCRGSFGAFLMAFFYFGNAGWAHGFVNGDLMGLLLFVTMIVQGAGRVMGLDAYLEETDFVRNHPRLKYLLG